MWSGCCSLRIANITPVVAMLGSDYARLRRE